MGAMGAWGTGIFQDDTACDIRDDYRNYLGNGLSGPEAIQKSLASYGSWFSDPDESGVVWFALAATQWKLGRLEPETLNRALQMIESGADLERWRRDRKCFRARQAVLEKFKTQITSPQPPARRVAKRSLCEWHLGVGDLFAINLLSGRLVTLRVTGTHTDKGGTYPECELLDWIGEKIPVQSLLENIGIKRSRPDKKHTITHLMLVGLSGRSASRIQTLGFQLQPVQKKGPCGVVHWKYFDKFLKEWFLFE
jgi:hypothetical protein